jgi:aspartate/methionine/tyrosine aminotransferase
VSKDSTVTRGLRKIEPSGTGSLFSVAQRVPNVINLAVGEPDFTPPAHVINAAKQALNEGRTHYVPSAGIPRLCEAIAEKAKNDHNLEYDPNNEVLVTIGATEAVFLALKAISSPGDEVLLLDPGFICYEPDVFLTGGKPIRVPIRKCDGFGLDVEAVMSHITKKSRVIIINSPNNPTGAVLA